MRVPVDDGDDEAIVDDGEHEDDAIRDRKQDGHGEGLLP